MRKVGFCSHERYFWHQSGVAACFLPAGGPHLQPEGHVENPETKRRFRNLLEAAGVMARLEPIAARPATEAELLRVHDADYVRKIEDLSARGGGDAGDFAPFGPGGFEIAALSAGGVIAAADAVADGAVDTAYVLNRPPGHHAEPDIGRGFCLFANGAIAAKHLQARGLERIAIVDYDVHHGNGAQRIFWEDPTVLALSIHQEALFPEDLGGRDERGAGPGFGATLNAPLPPGCGHGAYVAAFERVVAPALARFRPDFILVASGLDAAAIDPLGRMMAHSGTFRRLAEILVEAAEAHCSGRILFAHEGGYSTAYAPFAGLGVIEGMMGERSGVEDPFLSTFEAWGGQDLQPHQDAAIARAAALVDAIPGPQGRK